MGLCPPGSVPGGRKERKEVASDGEQVLVKGNWKGQGSKESSDSAASSPLNEQNLYCFTSVCKGDKGFPQISVSKEYTHNAGDSGSIPGSGRSPEEEDATHSSILAWEIPWTEKPGRLQSMGLQRV